MATEYDPGNRCRTDENGIWDLREGRNWNYPGFNQSDDHPVVCISWNDANAYVSWLNSKTGKDYKLLGEAEWEYAARAGSASSFSFGDQIDSRDANFNGNYTYNGSSKSSYHAQTMKVGSFQANDFGLYDMHGNAAEWVEDCYQETYVGAPTNGQSWVEENCENHILRGGSWFHAPQVLRSARRMTWNRQFRFDTTGFRVSRPIE